jgi:hypothetical protein
MCRVVLVVVLTVLTALGPSRPVRGEADPSRLFERLELGMTVDEVAAAGGGRLRGPDGRPVTTWLVWSPTGGSTAMAVLRAAFREGRLVRLQLEEFGEEYRRLVKEREPRIEMSRDEVGRLWRRAARLERAADDCQAALEAYHRLVLGAQNRLTVAEQASWVRALELRRETERHLHRVPSR